MFSFKEKTPIRLVIGLNQVDKMIPGGWNEKLNCPTKEAEKQLEKRAKDIISKLSKIAQLSDTHIEYYSALKRYRLIPLLSKVIANAYAGFKLDHIKPRDPFELADPEVKAFADQQRAKRNRGNQQGSNLFLEELSKYLSPQDTKLLNEKLAQEKQRPPKVAILGKAGVGKTTTINSVFNAEWKTSHTIVGTTEAQMKEFELKDGGGTLSVVDLPGYGRSLKEDAEYEKIYQSVIPACDVVLLIMQADARDLTDDQEMILKLTQWLKKSPTPQR